MKKALFALVCLGTSITIAPTASAQKPSQIDRWTAQVRTAPAAYGKAALHDWTPTAPFAGGTLVYATVELVPDGYDPKLKGMGDIMVLRKLSQPPEADLIKSSQVWVVGHLFDLQLSPNRQFILLKAEDGLLDQRDPYDAYIWDFKSKRIRETPPQGLHHQIVSWSLDDHYLAYYSGDICNDVPNELTIFDIKTHLSHAIHAHIFQEPIAWTHRNTLLIIGPPHHRPAPPTNQDHKTTNG